MKLFKQLLFISSSVVTFPLYAGEAASTAEGIQNPPVAEAAKNANEAKAPLSQEQKLLHFKTLGWMQFMQSGLKNLDMQGQEAEAFMAGIKSALNNEKAPCDLGASMDDLQKFMQERFSENEKKRQAEIKTTAAKNRAAGEAWLKDVLSKDSSIKKTLSGLAYKIKRSGNKARVADEDKVEILYVGKRIDGSVFDRSDNKKPVTLNIKNVIAGIKEGLALIGEGGEIVLYTPDNLAYGEYDIPDIPAGSTLVFEIKLQKVIKPVQEETATPAAKSEAQKPN
ncbi:MAG: FKBP-type peptidyl-prolyl cis-trans isomerase [Opitutales bacterium]|nr:FKBP-type peptidyl-prolyl cis-trans isomerase [Opitutales bacterium]